MATEFDPVRPSSSLARAAGFFYLLTILTGILAQFMAGQLVISDNAESTAANILSNENSFRIGFLADAVMTACYVVVTALFYRLFRSTNRVISLVAAFFSLVGCAMMAVSLLSYLAPLVVLKSSIGSFNTEQLEVLSLLILRVFRRSYDVGLIFFGAYCILIGFLAVKCDFIPRVIGFLMVFAGLGWLTYLWPPLAGYLEPYNLLPGLVGEGALALWLLVKGTGRTANNSFKPNPLRGSA